VANDKVPKLTEETIKSYPEPWQRFFRKQMASGTARTINPFAGGDLATVFELVAKIQREFRIDPDRIYVLGHSMGGAGTWNAIYERPEMFAAAIVSAGALRPWKDPKRIAQVPIWAFYGSADPLVPSEIGRAVFEAVKQCGGNMKYTEMKGVDHNVPAWIFHGDDEVKGYITRYSSDRCDKEGDVWDWLFKQKRN
jgi:predicted peptidase